MIDENDGEDWWTYQFHIFPFIMLMLDDENLNGGMNL